MSKVDEVIEKLGDEIVKLLEGSKYGDNDDRVTRLTFALARLVEARANVKDIIA